MVTNATASVSLAAMGDRPAVRRVLGSLIALLLLADLASIYLRPRQDVLTVDTAVHRFRANAPAQTVSVAPTAGPSGSGPSSPADALTATSTASDLAATPASKSATAGAGDAPRPSPGVAPVAPQPSRPAEGIYVYDTEGYEETDALSGARHDYPARSTVTVRAEGCGWTQRWQPLEQRWDELRFCRDGGASLMLRISTFHEFFRQTQQQDFECPPNSVSVPATTEPGTTSTFTCSGEFGANAFTGRVVDTAPVEVEGSSIPAIHVHVDVQFTGKNRGTTTIEGWFERSTGLLLQQIWDADVETDSPFGTVHYAEHYKVKLTSMRPRT